MYECVHACVELNTALSACLKGVLSELFHLSFEDVFILEFVFYF